MEKNKTQIVLAKSPTNSRKRPKQYKYAKPSKRFVLSRNASEYSINFTLTSKGRKSAIEKAIFDYVDAHQHPEITPFIFSRPVRGNDFLNYTSEIDWIAKELNTGENLIILFAGDGFGRTSLAMALEEKLRMKSEDTVTAYVSFREARSEWDILKRYVEAMFRALGIPDYRWGNINETNYDNQIPDVFDKPRAAAKALGKNLIAIVDDFDAIHRLPHPGTIEAKFRAAWQRVSPDERNISAIVLNNINNDTLNINRKFMYKGLRRFIKKIEPDLWVEYLQQRFQLADKTIQKDVVHYLVEKMNHIPKKIQFVCHNLALVKNTSITRQLVNKVIDKLITEKYWMYELQLGQLTELQQRVLFSYAEKTELDIPPQHLAKTISRMDEFLFYTADNSNAFRDPLLEAYILKRNAVPKKKQWSDFKRFISQVRKTILIKKDGIGNNQLQMAIKRKSDKSARMIQSHAEYKEVMNSISRLAEKYEDLKMNVSSPQQTRPYRKDLKNALDFLGIESSISNFNLLSLVEKGLQKKHYNKIKKLDNWTYSEFIKIIGTLVNLFRP